MDITIDTSKTESNDQTITVPSSVSVRADGTAVAHHPDSVGDVEYPTLADLEEAYQIDLSSTITTLNTKALNKFRDEYTDGSDSAVRYIPDEIRTEGRNAWVDRVMAELTESFPDAHRDDIEHTLRRMIDELRAAGLIGPA